MTEIIYLDDFPEYDEEMLNDELDDIDFDDMLDEIEDDYDKY